MVVFILSGIDLSAKMTKFNNLNNLFVDLELYNTYSFYGTLSEVLNKKFRYKRIWRYEAGTSSFENIIESTDPSATSDSYAIPTFYQNTSPAAPYYQDILFSFYPDIWSLFSSTEKSDFINCFGITEVRLS